MAEPGATREPHVYRVGELLAGLRALLEERVGRLWVVGEISNLHRARSGHMYFLVHRMEFFNQDGEAVSIVDWRMIQKSS
jgi:exonuclease VII large subunit